MFSFISYPLGSIQVKYALEYLSSSLESQHISVSGENLDSLAKVWDEEKNNDSLQLTWLNRD